MNACSACFHPALRIPTLATEQDTACCYAVQDKVWVTGPGAEPWEVDVVKADSDTLGKEAASACCARAAGTAGATQPAATACC